MRPLLCSARVCDPSRRVGEGPVALRLQAPGRWVRPHGLEPVSNVPQLCELLSVYESLEGESPDDPLGSKPSSNW